jgi:hypothetical protein
MRVELSISGEPGSPSASSRRIVATGTSVTPTAVLLYGFERT